MLFMHSPAEDSFLRRERLVVPGCGKEQREGCSAERPLSISEDEHPCFVLECVCRLMYNQNYELGWTVAARNTAAEPWHRTTPVHSFNALLTASTIAIA